MVTLLEPSHSELNSICLLHKPKLSRTLSFSLRKLKLRVTGGGVLEGGDCIYTVYILVCNYQHEYIRRISKNMYRYRKKNNIYKVHVFFAEISYDICMQFLDDETSSLAPGPKRGGTPSERQAAHR